MRAALIETPGAPAVPGERPEPTRGEGEVLVAVSAAPIVPLDRLCASGTSYFGVPPTPYGLADPRISLPRRCGFRLLPAPLGPAIATRAPAGSSRSTPSSAGASPAR